jgi:hypothetical protein
MCNHPLGVSVKWSPLGLGHHLILFAQELHQGAIFGATITPFRKKRDKM